MRSASLVASEKRLIAVSAEGKMIKQPPKVPSFALVGTTKIDHFRANMKSASIASSVGVMPRDELQYLETGGRRRVRWSYSCWRVLMLTLLGITLCTAAAHIAPHGVAGGTADDRSANRWRVKPQVISPPPPPPPPPPLPSLPF